MTGDGTSEQDLVAGVMETWKTSLLVLNVDGCLAVLSEDC